MPTKSATFVLLCVLSLTGYADDESRWRGVYEPISRACEGEGNLVIERSTMTWGDDCRNAKISTIRLNAREFVFKVEDKKGCALAKHTVSIAPEPSRITAAGFGVKTYEDGDRNFSYGSYCYFEKKK
jgi:hypothetical protein